MVIVVPGQRLAGHDLCINLCDAEGQDRRSLYQHPLDDAGMTADMRSQVLADLLHHLRFTRGPSIFAMLCGRLYVRMTRSLLDRRFFGATGTGMLPAYRGFLLISTVSVVRVFETAG